MSNDDRPVRKDRLYADDALIDGTAREMTLGAPSPALRERVHAQLASRGRRRGGSFGPARWRGPGGLRRPIWQAALGAAAMAVIALTLMPSRDELPPPRPIAPQIATGTAEDSAPEVRAPEVSAAKVSTAKGSTTKVNAPPPAVIRVAPRAVTRIETAAFAAREDETMLDPLVIPPVPVLVAAVEEISAPMPVRIESLEIRPLSIEE